MKPLPLFSRLAVACVAVCATMATALLPAADYTGFRLPAEPVLPKAETHPSLWFGANDVAALRAKKSADDLAARTWATVAASPYLTCPLPDVPARDAEKTPVHKYYGDMAQIAMYNALFYQLEEEPAAKQQYLDRATAALLRAFDGFIYEIDPKVNGTPVDEIYQGVWAQNYAAAYDWVQPALSAEDDAAIRVRLRGEAVYMHERLFSWASSPHNHLSKPAWGLGSLALVLAEEPEAASWLQRAIEASNMNTELFFSGDGIYREGSHYYIFSLINFLPFLYHYRNVSGVDAFGPFQPAFEWPVLVRNGRGWMPNIEDSYIRPYPSHWVAPAYVGRATRLSSRAGLGAVLQWNARNTDFAPFDVAEKRDGFNYSGASWDFPLELVEYLCYDPSIEPVAPDCSPTVFMEGGETVFRNDWSYNDPAHRYLLFQGVAESDNHMHAEHLAFIIQAENQMMASDSGYSRASYGEAIRKEWYVTAEAHNVVTLAGKAPQDVAENVTPFSRHRIDTPFFDFEEKEAPYPNGGKLRRAVAFPGQAYFVVADIVTSPAPAEAKLIFHGGRAGEAARQGNRFFWPYGDDDYGPAAWLSSWILSDGAELEKKSGEITYIKGDFAEFPYITATVKTEQTAFLQILYPHATTVAPPTLEDLSEGAVLAARLASPDATETFLAKPDATPAKAAGLATDATFAYLRTGEDVIAWFVRDATALSAEAAGDVLRAELPVTLAGCLVAQRDSYDIVVSPESERTFSLNTGTAPASATLDGAPIAFEMEGTWLHLALEHAGTVHLQFSETP